MTNISRLRERRDRLRRPLPAGWRLYFAADTGTYMSGLFGVFPPDAYDLFVVDEIPNYRYVGGEIELEGETLSEWSQRALTIAREYLPGLTKLKGLCDENSQFKTELKHHDILLRGNPRKLELRVEITREYFQNHRIHLAEWLQILPYELEQAVWPEDTNSAGGFAREKSKDHTLDNLEHICSTRPRSKHQLERQAKSFLQQQFDLHRTADRNPMRADPHIGSL